MFDLKNYYIMDDFQKSLLKTDIKVLDVHFKGLRKSIENCDKDCTEKEIKVLQEYLTMMIETLNIYNL